jgi:hypothetical protein
MNDKIKACFITGCVCLVVGIGLAIGGGWLLLRGTVEDAKLYNQIKDDYRRIKLNESTAIERIQSLEKYLGIYQDTITNITRQFGKIDSGLANSTEIIKRQSILIKQLDDGYRQVESIVAKGKVLQPVNP